MNKTQHRIIQNGLTVAAGLVLLGGAIKHIKIPIFSTEKTKPDLEQLVKDTPQTVKTHRDMHFPDFVMQEAINENLYSLTRLEEMANGKKKFISRKVSLAEYFDASKQFHSFINEKVPKIFPIALKAAEGDSTKARYIMGKAYAESRGIHETGGIITQSSAKAYGILQIKPHVLRDINLDPVMAYDLKGNLTAGTKFSQYYDDLIKDGLLRSTIAYREGIKTEENLARALLDLPILVKGMNPSLDLTVSDDRLKEYWDFLTPSARHYVRTIAVVMHELGEHASHETPKVQKERRHLVRKGDNLYAISKEYFGNEVQEGIKKIREANDLSSDTINPYQKLTIPTN